MALRMSGGFPEGLFHRLLDERYDAHAIVTHVVIHEPKYAVALSMQHVFSFEIVASLKLMDRTVDFDDETMLDAQKIDDIHPERNLPPEFCARTFPQNFPHDFFRKGHSPAQVMSKEQLSTLEHPGSLGALHQPTVTEEPFPSPGGHAGWEERG